MTTSSNPITPQMNPEKLKEFLAKPHLMDLATITPDGYPHVTPVWFEYDREFFWVSTTKERKKARNIGLNPKVGFSVASHELPYPAVVGYGEVTFEQDSKGELLRRLAHKYLPADLANDYFKELMDASGTRVILKIKPKWILSWAGE